MSLKTEALHYIQGRIAEQMQRLSNVVKFAQAPTKANTVALICDEIECLINLAKLIRDATPEKTKVMLQGSKSTLMAYAKGDFARGNAAMFVNPSKFHSQTYNRSYDNLEALEDLLSKVDKIDPQAEIDQLKETSAYITLVALEHALKQTKKHPELGERLTYAIVALNVINTMTERKSLKEDIEFKGVRDAVKTTPSSTFKPMEKEMDKTNLEPFMKSLQEKVDKLQLDEVIKQLRSEEKSDESKLNGRKFLKIRRVKL